MGERRRRALSSRELALLSARLAESKKASGIEIIKLRRSSSLADYLVLCSGESFPQLRAIAETIERGLKEKGLKPPVWEGALSSNWRVLDLGRVVVHVMGEEERVFYALEKLWGEQAIIYHL